MIRKIVGFGQEWTLELFTGLGGGTQRPEKPIKQDAARIFPRLEN
jgi:hypothetical protein